MRERWLTALAVVAALAPACAPAHRPSAAAGNDGSPYSPPGGGGYSVHVSPYATDDPSSLSDGALTCTGASLSSCSATDWGAWPGMQPAPTTTTPETTTTLTQPVASTAPPTTTTTIPVSPPITASPIGPAPTMPTTTTTRPPRAGKKKP